MCVCIIRSLLSLSQLLPVFASSCSIPSTMDDFGPMNTPQKSDRKRMRADEQGAEREWLRVYETGPAQMLNAYGQAKHVKLTDPVVWDAVSKPLKSGAKYMTEYASQSKERRGIAANRWLKSLLDYLEYQETEKGRKQNKVIMKEAMYEEFYEEIGRIKPAVAYCLAPKKVSEKGGAASLRAAACPSMPKSEEKNPEQLANHAKTLYDWLSVEETSRIRMMMLWQACGGLSFVVSVHHRMTQCFRYHGNSKHEGSTTVVSLLEFQESIKDRHRIGHDGIDEAGQNDSIDYAEKEKE